MPKFHVYGFDADTRIAQPLIGEFGDPAAALECARMTASTSAAGKLQVDETDPGAVIVRPPTSPYGAVIRRIELAPEVAA